MLCALHTFHRFRYRSFLRWRIPPLIRLSANPVQIAGSLLGLSIHPESRWQLLVWLGSACLDDAPCCLQDRPDVVDETQRQASIFDIVELQFDIAISQEPAGWILLHIFGLARPVLSSSMHAKYAQRSGWRTAKKILKCNGCASCGIRTQQAFLIPWLKRSVVSLNNVSPPAGGVCSTCTLLLVSSGCSSRPSDS